MTRGPLKRQSLAVERDTSISMAWSRRPYRLERMTGSRPNRKRGVGDWHGGESAKESGISLK